MLHCTLVRVLMVSATVCLPAVMRDRRAGNGRERTKRRNAAYMQGSVLYSNYGYKSNEELIVGYGFAVPDNPANFFHVMIGLADRPNSGTQPVCQHD